MSRLGIIAGGGSLPKRLIDACQREQRDFFVLGLQGQTDPEILKNIPHGWSRLGATDAAIGILKAQHVDTLVMAGSVRRPVLSELKPDWRTIRIFAQLGKAAFGDDALLRAVMQELEREGFKVTGAHEIEPALITPEGLLTQKAPSPDHQIDIDHGIRIVKMLGQLDIGQAVVVQQGIVLGVEAVEGTDALLARCKQLRRKDRKSVV